MPNATGPGWNITPKKSGCALEIGRCSGMKNTARRYRRRTGLWIGAGLLVVGLLVMSRFVWRVEVQGTERLEPEDITAALAEYGVRSGALASGIDARTCLLYTSPSPRDTR